MKARRALANDESGRVRAYVDRAVRLPYDRHEQGHPVAMEAHLAIFCLVADELEDADPQDRRWLDAALAALAAADDAGRSTMRDVLAAIDDDYDLTKPERASLRSAIATVPERPRDIDLPPAEMAQWVLSVLAVWAAYEEALAAG